MIDLHTNTSTAHGWVGGSLRDSPVDSPCTGANETKLDTKQYIRQTVTRCVIVAEGTVIVGILLRIEARMAARLLPIVPRKYLGLTPHGDEDVEPFKK